MNRLEQCDHHVRKTGAHTVLHVRESTSAALRDAIGQMPEANTRFGEQSNVGADVVSTVGWAVGELAVTEPPASGERQVSADECECCERKWNRVDVKYRDQTQRVL